MNLLKSRKRTTCLAWERRGHPGTIKPWNVRALTTCLLPCSNHQWLPLQSYRSPTSFFWWSKWFLWIFQTTLPNRLVHPDCFEARKTSEQCPNFSAHHPALSKPGCRLIPFKARKYEGTHFGKSELQKHTRISAPRLGPMNTSAPATLKWMKNLPRLLGENPQGLAVCSKIYE